MRNVFIVISSFIHISYIWRCFKEIRKFAFFSPLYVLSLSITVSFSLCCSIHPSVYLSLSLSTPGHRSCQMYVNWLKKQICCINFIIQIYLLVDIVLFNVTINCDWWLIFLWESAHKHINLNSWRKQSPASGRLTLWWPGKCTSPSCLMVLLLFLNQTCHHTAPVLLFENRKLIEYKSAMDSR